MTIKPISITTAIFRLIVVAGLIIYSKANAATRVEATITVTNTAATGDLVQFNSQGRWWTNNTLASTNWIITTNSAKASATNLFSHAVANPFSNVVQVAYASPTSVVFYANYDTPLSGSVTGSWATISFKTNYIQTSGPVTMPYPTNVTEAFRTNQMTALMASLQTNSQIAPTAFGAFGRFVDTNTAQVIVGKTMQASTYTGTIGALTNGYATNTALDSPKLTNAVNSGTAFSSRGTNTQSEQFGQNATAKGIGALSVGYTADADGVTSIALGYSAQATETNSMAIGLFSSASGYQSMSIGGNSQASGRFAIALGSAAQSTYSNAIAIGYAVESARDNEIRLGGSQDVVIGGLLFAEKGATNLALHGIVTNSTLVKDGIYTNAILQNPIVTNLSGSLSGISAITVAGSAFILTNVTLREVTLAGSNTLAGDLALTARSVTTLTDGYNSGVNIGTNYFVRLSGGSVGVTNAGFVAGSRDGEIHLLEIIGGTNFVVLNDSGLEATVGNRIITGTGGTLVLTNVPAYLEVIYATSASRWRVIKASQ